MFTTKQSRGSLCMGVLAVLTMSSAIVAQVRGSSAQTDAPTQLSAGVHVISSQGVEIGEEWISLGNALAGVAGLPSFTGSGLIAAGERAKLTLSGAAPSSLAVFFVSLDSAPQPFKGGVLVPAAPAFTSVLMTDSLGQIILAISASANVPEGLDLVMQYAIADAAAVQGVALSNALQTSTH